MLDFISITTRNTFVLLGILRSEILAITPISYRINLLPFLTDTVLELPFLTFRAKSYLTLADLLALESQNTEGIQGHNFLCHKHIYSESFILKRKGNISQILSLAAPVRAMLPKWRLLHPEAAKAIARVSSG